MPPKTSDPHTNKTLAEKLIPELLEEVRGLLQTVRGLLQEVRGLLPRVREVCFGTPACVSAINSHCCFWGLVSLAPSLGRWTDVLSKDDDLSGVRVEIHMHLSLVHSSAKGHECGGFCQSEQ